MVLRSPGSLDEAELRAQLASIDYACILGSCELLPMLRPATEDFRVVPPEECAAVVLPTSLPASTTRAPLTAPPAVATEEMHGLGTPKPQEDPDAWPNSWGALQWLAVSAPVAVLCSTACGLWLRRRSRARKQQRRVHVEPAAASAAWTGAAATDKAALWDFTQAGPLSPEQIEGAEAAMAEASRAARAAGLPPPQRRIVVGPQNELRKPHLVCLQGLLSRHPATSLLLEADWRSASESTLEELVRMLQLRGRCSFRGTRQEAGGARLRLPLRADPTILGSLAEALAVAGHAVVDAISLETMESAVAGATPPVVVALGPMRLSPQELVLSRQHIGDAGCAVACGFVRPWAGRLIAIRLLECEIGDVGAAEIARLLLGAPRGSAGAPTAAAAAGSLRELVLSANRIGDSGISKIAEALPRCDGLERLLVDRNAIGPAGAAALARRLPRSSIRELVLGSHLGSNGLGPGGVEALAAALGDELGRAATNRGTRLEALALEGCGTGERGARALAAALPGSALTVLSLARGQLGDAGAAAVLQALPPGMLSLDLAGNELSDDVGAAVGEVLYRMPSLSLSLAQNDLSPGLKALLRDEYGARLRV